MSTKSLGNPFDEKSKLTHTQGCECASCTAEKSTLHLGDRDRQAALEHYAETTQDKAIVLPDAKAASKANELETSEDMLDRAIESAIVRGMFGHNEASRRSFMKLIGGGVFASALSSILPMDEVKAAVKESTGKLEKTKLKIGFVPITCATPIIMAHPMGFYSRHGR